jgi:hypothetical protein
VALTASARVLVRGGTVERTGEALTASVVAERVGWCAALVRGMAAGIVAERWNAADVAVLASEQGPDGRPLPTNAWMAVRRLGWHAAPPPGARVNDRVMRMAQELAGRVLRSACWRAALTSGVLATWPADPGKRTAAEWDEVRAAVPGGEHLPSGIIRARTRQVQKFAAARGRLPADVFDLEPPPAVAGLLILAACDRQMAAIERHEADPSRALLRLQLPTRPDPRGYRDWEWVAVPLRLPPTVPAGAVVHLPTLRIASGRAWADTAHTRPVPAPRRGGHETGLGIDWGLNTLLSAGSARLQPDGTITALGSGAQYRASGVLAKAHRLRRQGEALYAKLGRYEQLAAGRDSRPLEGKQAVTGQEAAHVAGRRSNLNSALAWSAARWAVDQAAAEGASVIYLEDLRSMEARGMSRTMNVRLSQVIRGQIVERIRHLAAKEGIAVVTVPARGTSRYCPRCLGVLRHCKAPDRPQVPGWKWARCPGCGWQGDRDTGAWQRIAARGLAHQHKTSADRTSGAMTIRTVDNECEQRAVIAVPSRACGQDRSKAGPTSRRISRRAPRRRTAPPTPPPGGVQRPGGRATTAWPCRDQGAHAISTIPATRDRPHRVRGAALGAGFHRNAHATPPRRELIHKPSG